MKNVGYGLFLTSIAILGLVGDTEDGKKFLISVVLAMVLMISGMSVSWIDKRKAPDGATSGANKKK